MGRSRRSGFLAVLAIALAAVGCHGSGPSATPSGSTSATTSPATTSSSADDSTVPSLGDDGQALVASNVDQLASALQLSPAERDRVLAATLRAWSDVASEIARRASDPSAPSPLDGPAVSALLEDRQRALDAEIAAGLTPEQQQAFAAFGGRTGAP